MDFAALHAALDARGEKPYRARQIKEAFCSGKFQSWEQLSMLPLPLRESLAKEVPWLAFDVTNDVTSIDGTRKIVVKLRDGLQVESVLMNYDNGRNTVCVSSQVGCAMNCAFCATGKMGFKRNLTPYEIADQIAYFDQALKERFAGVLSGNAMMRNAMEHAGVDNIVFMGMGEPLHNYENVAQALRLLQDPKAFGFGWRRLSVSTSGLVPEIMRLAEEFPQVNLAVSLHAPNDELRSRIMPINNGFPVKHLMDACSKYVARTHRKIFFEYLLLKGVNDGYDTARELAELLSVNPLFHLNLIKYHPIGHAKDKAATSAGAAQSTEFHAPSFDDVHEFGGWLKEFGLRLVTIRRTFGEDIQAACGQLVLETKK